MEKERNWKRETGRAILVKDEGKRRSNSVQDEDEGDVQLGVGQRFAIHVHRRMSVFQVVRDVCGFSKVGSPTLNSTMLWHWYSDALRGKRKALDMCPTRHTHTRASS